MPLAQRGFQTYDGNNAPDFVKNGNFVLNKDSAQAQGLKLFAPCHRLFGEDLVSRKSLTMNSDIIMTPRKGHGSVWEASAGGNEAALVDNSADGDLDFGLADPFTLSARFEQASLGQSSTLLSKCGSDAGQRQYQLFITSDAATARIHGAQTSWGSLGTDPHMATIAKSGAEATNDVSHYLDGNFVSNGTAGTDATNNADVIIGARRGDDSNVGFGFQMDAGLAVWDAAIWNRELTPTEIFHLWIDPWDLYYETGRRVYAFVAAGFIPYPNPRYALDGGMQAMRGGV